MTQFKIYAEDMNGKRRFIEKAWSDDSGNGLFDLYADECADDEQIVIVGVLNNG